LSLRLYLILTYAFVRSRYGSVSVSVRYSNFLLLAAIRTYLEVDAVAVDPSSMHLPQ